jgi:hypothetical protein
MHDAGDFARLRELFLTHTDLEATRWLALAISGALLVAVLGLVRRRALREELTPIWVATSLALVLLSFRLEWLRQITRAIGAWTPSSTVFFLGELFLLAICLHYAVRLSRAALRIQTLAQELALLRARVEEVERARPAR